MEVQVNVWAIVLATLSSMVVGTLWYGPVLFLKPWLKLGRVVQPKKDEAQKKMVQGMLWAVVASGMMAFVLAHFAYIMHQFYLDSFLYDTMITAVWIWLGFQGLRTFMSDSFENRPFGLSLINAGNSFVTLMVMALIIGLMQP